jgi:hypothetical protein
MEPPRGPSSFYLRRMNAIFDLTSRADVVVATLEDVLFHFDNLIFDFLYHVATIYIPADPPFVEMSFDSKRHGHSLGNGPKEGSE